MGVFSKKVIDFYVVRDTIGCALEVGTPNIVGGCGIEIQEGIPLRSAPRLASVRPKNKRHHQGIAVRSEKRGIALGNYMLGKGDARHTR